MRNGVSIFCLLISGAICLAVPAWADDVLEAIDEAKKFYQEGDHTEALSSLEYAAQLIRQQRGEQLEDYLPEPLTGWTAKKASSQAVSGMVMGGAVTAERDYEKNGSSVHISMVTDSPMMQSVLMMFNPMLATASGAKLKRINGEKALVEYDEESQNGEIKAVVAQRVLVTVKGHKVTRNELEAYAEAIDFKKLEKAF